MNPQNTSFAARLVAGGAGLFAAVAMTSLPAYAEDPAPQPSATMPSASAAPTASSAPVRQPTETKADLSVALASSFVPVDSGMKAFRVDLRNHGPDPAKQVTLTIDAGSLSNAVRIDFDDTCQVRGRFATCQVERSLPARGMQLIKFGLEAPAGTPQGEAGSITVSVSSATLDPDLSNNRSSAAIRVVQQTADLVVVGDDLADIDPGSTTSLSFSAYNSSTLTARSLELEITLPRYVTFADRYANCEYTDRGHTVLCEFDAVIPAYHIWTVSQATPFRVTVAKEAPGPVNLGVATVRVTALDAVAPRHTGDVALSLVRAADATRRVDADPDGGDSSVDLMISTTSNPADVAALGAKVTAQVGDTVTVKLGEKNHGPADTVAPGEGSSVGTVTVTVPEGTEVVDAPKRCHIVGDDGVMDPDEGEAGGRVYRCFPTARLESGETVRFSFKLKITDAEVAAGKVEADGGTLDNKPDNNTAQLEVTIGTGGSGGGLPATGTNLVGLVGGGLGALLLGTGLLLLTRRRAIEPTTTANPAV